MCSLTHGKGEEERGGKKGSFNWWWEGEQQWRWKICESNGLDMRLLEH